MEVRLLTAFVFAFIATAAFGVLFQAPKKSLPVCGVIGAIGWVAFVYIRKELGYNSFPANFCATVLLSLASELSARWFKQPSTVYIIPGVIPLVPGLGMYQGMTQLIEKNYDLGMSILLTAILDSVAIALGVMVVTSFFRVLKLSRRHQREEKVTGCGL